MVPAKLAEKIPCWKHKKLSGAALGPILVRLAELREAGLTAGMIAKEFLRYCIAPL